MAGNLPFTLDQIAELKKSISDGTAVVTPTRVMMQGDGGDWADTAYMLKTPSGLSAEATLQSGGRLALDLSSPDSKVNYTGYFNFDPSTGKTAVIGDPSTFMAPRVNVGSRGGLFGDVAGFASDFLSSDIGKAARLAAMAYGLPGGEGGLLGGGLDAATAAEGWGGAGAVGSGNYGVLDGVGGLGGAIASPVASSAGEVVATPLESFNPDFATSVEQAPVVTSPQAATSAIDTSLETVPSPPPVENVPPPEATAAPATETTTPSTETTPSTTPTGTPASNVGGNVLPKITTGIPIVDKAITNIAAGTIAKAVMPGNTTTPGSTTNPAGTTPGSSDLGGLLGGLLNAGANYSASNTVSEANKNAATGSQFRPVGITNTFGTSNFTINPATGELTSAGVTMTPEMIAMQNALKTASGGSLTDLTNIQNLARGYISKTPEQAAADWMAKQNALLAPSQDLETSRLLNQLQQGGRTGVSVSQGQGMLSANPEYNALMNARTMAQLKLAADATKQGQDQTLFGVNLLSDAYKPFNTNLATTSAFNTAAMSPMTTSADLAKTSATTNAGAANYLKASQAVTPGADFISSLSKNPLFQSAAGQTFLKSALGQKVLTYLTSGSGNGLDLGGGISIDASGNIVGGTDIAESNPGAGSGDWQQDPDTGNWYEA